MADKLGALVLHGFTGVPSDLLTLTEHLRQRGFDVECPILPGHGTSPRELQRTGWGDWFAAAEKSLDALLGRTSSVGVTGLSMGGLLALLLGARRPEVAAVCTLATPLWLPLTVRIGVRFLGPVVRYFPKGGADVRDLTERFAKFGYNVFPMLAARSLLELQTEVQRSLVDIKAPTLVIHSRQDHTAPYESAQELVAKVPNARLHTLHRSFHLLTRDIERGEVSREVCKFLEEELNKEGELK